MRVRNKGQISVYACAMLCVFLTLILTVLQGIRIWEGKAKCRQAVSAAANSIKGDYQPDLFRRYHILALDKTYYGRGEGYLEERAESYLEYNLNPAAGLYHFSVINTSLADTRNIMEEDLAGYKEQIEAYMKLKLPINIVEEVFEKAGDRGQSMEQEGISAELEGVSGNSEFSLDTLPTPSSDILQLAGLDDVLRGKGIHDTENLTSEDLLNLNLSSEGLLQNPQTIMEDLSKMDILNIVIPEQSSSISRESIDRKNLPSLVYGQTYSGGQRSGSRSIQSISDITRLFAEDTFQDSLNHLPTATEEELYGIAYALDSFQHFGNGSWAQSDTEFHALECELEYILAGQMSDYENLTQIAEELSLIRFVPNAVYAFRNEEMKEAALLVAALVLAPIGLEGAAEPVSYVFLACWAYAESLMDVRNLLQGESVPFFKDRDTWQLSLNGIQNLASKETSGCDRTKGMNYEEYLMILLAGMPERQWKYERMLDVMQVNIQENIPGFKMENCIYGFELQTEISLGNRKWFFEGTGCYLP